MLYAIIKGCVRVRHTRKPQASLCAMSAMSAAQSIEAGVSAPHSDAQTTRNTSTMHTVKVYRPVAPSSSSQASTLANCALPRLTSQLDTCSHASLAVPDSYFTPSVHELSVAYNSQTKIRERMTEAPMLTRRLRDEKAAQAAAEKRAKYPQTRIRIKFADQTQIETSFASSLSIEALYAFVWSSLREDMQASSFLLCVLFLFVYSKLSGEQIKHHRDRNMRGPIPN